MVGHPGVAASLGFTPTWGRLSADVFKAEHIPAIAPLSMSRPLHQIIILALVFVSSSYAQEATESPWARLVERDKRVSFTSRTELAAMTALNGGGLDLDDRAASLFALGASGSTRVRSFLEESVANDANDALRDGRLDGHHAESALPAVLVTADGRLVRQAAQH